MYNLLHESWIPVICRSGKTRMIRPFEIVDQEDPPLQIRFNRPEFNTAVHQFLIQLCQTALTPADEDEWIDRIESPPSQQVLKDAFEKYSYAFELLGDGKRYMQQSIKNDKCKPMSAILISNPGESTLKHNKDFFVKRTNDCLCLSCSAAAITMIQFIAPKGGSGLKSSARGGSAITTTVVGKTLWQDVYLNVLQKNNLKRIGSVSTEGDPFPWITGMMSEESFPITANQLSIYWAAVRKIQLGDAKESICSICGSRGLCVSNLAEEPRGNSYPNWVHPLAPTFSKDGHTRSSNMTLNTMHMDQWPSMVYEGLSDVTPALNIIQAKNTYDLIEVLGQNALSVRISGFINENASTLAWIESEIPSYRSPNDDETQFIFFIKGLIKSSLFMRKKLYASVRGLSSTIGSQVDQRFWAICDNRFNDLLDYYGRGIDAGVSSWISDIRNDVLSLFDELTESIDDNIRHSGSNKYVAKNKLRKQISDKAVLKEVNNDK